jgi:GTP cyclohydrolase II
VSDRRDARRAVARGIDALRRGWPIVVGVGDGALTLLAIEAADAGRLADFAPDGRYDVLLSPERAATLRLDNQRAAAESVGRGAVRVAQVPWLDLDTATALADPSRDLSTPFKGPFDTRPLAAIEEAAAALKLARLAGLLPAFFVRDDGGPDDAPRLSAEAIRDYDAASHLGIAARARLPV